MNQAVMDLQVYIEPRPEYLYVQISGKFNLRKAKDFSYKVMVTAKEHDLDYIIADARKLDPNFPILDRFLYAIFSVTVQEKRKIAFIESPEYYKDGYEENVAVNRGANTRVVTDIKDAFKWLQIKPDCD